MARRVEMASRCSRRPSPMPAGSYMPIRRWLHYADHVVAPICRSATGSYMPITDWLLYGGR
ncbi:MAG: hypothetical protein ACK56F_27165 [bacterium]